MEIKQGQFQMLPPAPGTCRVCAQVHEEDLPHNRDSLYYQFWFHAQYGRSPTWADAMLHCTPEMRAAWARHLREHNVPEEKIGKIEGGR